jgi:predicted phage tail protein
MKNTFILLLLILGSNFALASDTDQEKIVSEYIEKLEGLVSEFENELKNVKEDFRLYKELHKNCLQERAHSRATQAQVIQPAPVQPTQGQMNFNFQPYPTIGRSLFFVNVNGTIFYDATHNVQWYQPFNAQP